MHATALLFVAYTGYGRIATLGEEVREPARTIPRAIIATLVLAMLIYLAVAFTALRVAGPDSFAAATRQSGAPLETLARAFNSPWAAKVIGAGAVTAMVGVLLNLLLGLSRVVLAMARRREMPAGLEHIGKNDSPSRAVWAVGIFVALLVLIGDLRTTWSFSAFSVLVYYGLTNLAALRLPEHSRRFPRWIALTGLVACFGLAFFVPWQIWATGMALLSAGLIWRMIATEQTGG